MLYFCKAFSWNGVCRKCGCSQYKHMHIAWEYVSITRAAISPKAEIHNKEDAIAQVDAAIKKTQQLVAEYKVELQTIQNINAKFACVLSTDSCLVSLFYSIKTRKAIAIALHRFFQYSHCIRLPMCNAAF